MNLKEGGSTPTGDDATSAAAELDSVRQERDMIREELQHARMALETARLEFTVNDPEIQIVSCWYQNR